MRTPVLLPLVLALLLVPMQVYAKAVRTPISTGTAEGLCASHGGGTECSFCKRGHCYSVSCLGQRCTKTVFTRSARSFGTGLHPPRSGYAPPQGNTHPWATVLP